MLKNFKKRKKNNKGFTLVELVVVIAILAILVGLLVPQYTKYVDKARKSSDASNLANMVRAVEIAAADPNGILQPDDGIVIYITTTGSYVTTKNTNNKVATVISEINKTVGDGSVGESTNKAGSVKLKSTSWTDTNGIYCTIKIGKDYSFTTTYSTEVQNYLDSKDGKA